MNTQSQTANTLPRTPPGARIAGVARKLLNGLVQVIRDVHAANELWWQYHQRIDPQPSAELHWEPTLSGWRIYGDHLPRGQRCPR